MKKKVLIVDDSLLFINYLRGVLEAEGYAVFACAKAQELFDTLRANSIDVILLDVVMPQVDGFEVLSMLQRDDELRDIPVLLVTGLNQAEHLKRGLDLGATDYIKKPFENIEIVARVAVAARLKEKHEELMRYATTDGLTKVYNRAYLDKQLLKLLKQCASYPKGVGLIMLDCDYFKDVNDQHGHAVGDEVLKALATIMRCTVKNIDTVGRYGGEEFCVFLPNTSLEESYLAAERIRRNVEARAFVANVQNRTSLKITVSLGVANAPQDSQIEPVELYRQADEALYWAKRGGRNKTEMYSMEAAMKEWKSSHA